MMQCISTPLSEDELLAIMSEVADPTVLEHLEQCGFCQEQLKRLEQMEGRLRQRLYRWDCPDAETLGAFALNLLPAEEHSQIADHVQDCPVCRQDLAAVRHFWEVIDEAEDREYRQIARPEKPPSPTAIPRPMRHPIPVMRGAMSTGAAFRGDGPQSFELDGLRLVVFATQEQGYYELNGQLLGPEAPNWRSGLVRARQGETKPILGIINERGKFQCRLPTADDANLTITAQNGMTITIEGVRIAPG
jgi:hypothetical protein